MMRALIDKWRGALRDALRVAAVSVGSFIASAMTWFVLLSVAGFSLIVSAVYILSGLGWALLACGIVLLLFAGFVMRGLANG
jgi:hypothetical protein